MWTSFGPGLCTVKYCSARLHVFNAKLVLVRVCGRLTLYLLKGISHNIMSYCCNWAYLVYGATSLQHGIHWKEEDP